MPNPNPNPNLTRTLTRTLTLTLTLSRHDLRERVLGHDQRRAARRDVVRLLDGSHQEVPVRSVMLMDN